MRNLLQGSTCLEVQPPSSNTLPHTLGGARTQCRRERDKHPPLSAPNETRAKLIAQEGKLLGQVVRTLSLHVATHNLGFLWMQLKLIHLQAFVECRLKPLGFRLRVAVHHRVIRITSKWKMWKGPYHPLVQRIVQEQIRQYSTDTSALWSPTISGDLDPIGLLKGCFEPTLNVQAHPPTLRMLGHSS